MIKMFCGLKFKIQDSGFKIQDLGFRIENINFSLLD